MVLARSRVRVEGQGSKTEGSFSDNLRSREMLLAKFLCRDMESGSFLATFTLARLRLSKPLLPRTSVSEHP